MAVLTQTEQTTMLKEALIANVSTDAPFDSTQLQEALNHAYQMLWEEEGGGIREVDSATAWTSAQTATGRVVGILQTIKEVTTLFASSSSGSTGITAGDKVLRRVEYPVLQWYRGNYGGVPTYTAPKVYSLIRLANTTPSSSNVGLLQLDYFPGVTGFYFPVHFVPQFVPLNGTTVTQADLTDIASRDMVWLAAIDLVVSEGRAELVPKFELQLSRGAQDMLKRKAEALTSGDQNA